MITLNTRLPDEKKSMEKRGWLVFVWSCPKFWNVGIVSFNPDGM